MEISKNVKQAVSKSATLKQYAALQTMVCHLQSQIKTLVECPESIVTINQLPGKTEYRGGFYPTRFADADGNQTIGELALSPRHINRPLRDVLIDLISYMVRGAHFARYGLEKRKQYNFNYASQTYADMLKEIGLQPLSTSGDGKETGQRVNCTAVPGGLVETVLVNLPEEIKLPWVHIGYPTKKVGGAKKDNPGTLQLALADKGECTVVAKWSDIPELLKRGFVLTLKAEEKLVEYAEKMVADSKNAQIPAWVVEIMQAREAARKAKEIQTGTADTVEVAQAA